MLAERDVDVDLVVPHDRPRGAAVLFEFEESVVFEFADVREHVRRVAIDGVRELPDARRLGLDDRVEEFEGRRPEDPAEGLEILDGEGRVLGLDGLTSVERGEIGLEIPPVGTPTDSDGEGGRSVDE